MGWKTAEQRRAYAKKYYSDPKNVEARRAQQNAKYKNDAEWRERRLAAVKEYKRKNPGYRLIVELRSKYKISPEEYAALLRKQKGLCAVCRQPERAKLRGKTKRLALDHCHRTGKIRGMLCSRCNTALGLLGDSVPLLRAAIKYMVKHRT